MWMGLANSYATNSSGIRRQRGRRMEFVPRDGVERVDASCSISRTRFIRKTLVLVLFHILLHFTKVVALLTRRGTNLFHFYGELLYIDLCRLVEMVMQLSIILLHITNVVESLTRRGTSLVHFYGQLLYIDFCRLVGMGIQLSIIAILLNRALVRAPPSFPPRASTATAAPIPPPILPPALTPKVARATTRESPRTQNAKSYAEGHCPKTRGYFPNVKGQGRTVQGQMQEAKSKR